MRSGCTRNCLDLRYFQMLIGSGFRAVLARSVKKFAIGAGVLSISGVVFGQGGLPVWIEGPDGSGEFGRSVTAVGDLSGDGLADVVVIDPSFTDANGDVVGAVRAYRGFDGLALWSVEDIRVGTGGLGFATVSPIDDVNQDHVADVVLGEPFASPNGLDNAGVVKILSGKDGSTILTIDGAEVGGLFGYEVRSLRDVTGDDLPDLVIISKRAEAGRVSIVSTADASVVHEFAATWPRRLAIIGDITGDAHDEILLGMWGGIPRQGYGAEVLDSETGSVLRHYAAPNPPEDFGYQLGVGGDVTGDDVPDFIISVDFGGFHNGSAALYSGKTGALLKLFEPKESIGYAAIADVDGDHRNDILLGGGEIAAIHPADDIAFRSYFGSADGAIFGRGVDMADLNGDGISDFIFGYYENNTLNLGAGSVLGLMMRYGPVRYLSPITFFRSGDQRQNAVDVADAVPSNQVWVLYSLDGHDCTFIPQIGMCIDLTQPIHLLGSVVADGDGNGSLSFKTPVNAPVGQQVWFQAVELNHGSMGAVVSEVQEGVVVE